MNFEFVIQSLMVGLGLAMDSCTVSMTDGMNEKNMTIIKNILIALIFAIFQQVMPIVGYFIGRIFYGFISKICDYNRPNHTWYFGCKNAC